MDQAESLRNVIREQNRNENSKARVLTVTSGKGGVGKSNVSVNLAVQLRKRGKRVIIFDADIGLANVEVMFGSIPRYNLGDLIYKGRPIREIITPGPLNIGFISGGSGVVGLNNLTREQLQFLIQSLDELDRLCDVLIIDTGAGISDSVMQFVQKSPEVLLVSTPEPSSLTDSYSLLKALHKSPDFDPENCTVRLIANKAQSTEDGQAVFEKLNTVVHQFLNGEITFLGLIPYDPELEKAVRSQKTVSLFEPGAKSSKAFELLADNLLEDKNESFLIRRGIGGMLSQIFGKR